MQLAELNIATLKHPTDDLRVAGSMDNKHFAKWWVEDGHEPAGEEALDRLEHLRANGPSDHAFGWESLPQVQKWKEARCG